ncbi:hypothetical protein B0T22DRAFT_100241 [Podospora appendiculata]|uniref:Uncharacterized protein n=1 Tax=Podospora appendiculata TaxID=314037 RepID=A0AAE0XL09_9PEZI|nr:hypothetical protein B0T22DRAFT_100241 [Podospora appendiculata]
MHQYAQLLSSILSLGPILHLSQAPGHRRRVPSKNSSYVILRREKEDARRWTQLTPRCFSHLQHVSWLVRWTGSRVAVQTNVGLIGVCLDDPPRSI